MGRASLIGADAAREVIDFTRKEKGKPFNDQPPERARWPLGSSPSFDLVRSSNIVANANGYSPGFIQTWTPTQGVNPAGTWSDGAACQIVGLFGETLAPGHYAAVSVAPTQDGTPTYVSCYALAAGPDNANPGQVETVTFDHNWFSTAAGTRPGSLNVSFVTPFAYVTISSPPGGVNGLYNCVAQSALFNANPAFASAPFNAYAYWPAFQTIPLLAGDTYGAFFNGTINGGPPLGTLPLYYVFGGGWLLSAQCNAGVLTTVSY